MSHSNITPMIKVPFVCYRHVAAYLRHKYRQDVRIKDLNSIRKQIIMCLSHQRAYYETSMNPNWVRFEIQITALEARRYGSVLNGVQNNLLNTFIDDYLRDILVAYLDSYLVNKKNLQEAIENFYTYMNMTEDDWSYDAIKRYYHRIRTERGDTMLRK